MCARGQDAAPIRLRFEEMMWAKLVRGNDLESGYVFSPYGGRTWIYTTSKAGWNGLTRTTFQEQPMANTRTNVPKPLANPLLSG